MRNFYCNLYKVLMNVRGYMNVIFYSQNVSSWLPSVENKFRQILDSITIPGTLRLFIFNVIPRKSKNSEFFFLVFQMIFLEEFCSDGILSETLFIFCSIPEKTNRSGQ